MPALTDNVRGAFFMMASMGSFTVNDACMKAMSDELPLFQAIALRGVPTCILLFLLARAVGGMTWDLSRRDWGLIALRTIAEVGAAYFFITALFNMPLANASAILQSLPLTVTLAGAIFMGEAVGWRRLTAILVGLCGVLLIVRPGAEGFTFYSIYALISVACVTVRDLAVRRLSREVSSFTVALTAALAVTLFGAIASLTTDWAPVSQKATLQLAGASVMVIGGYMFSVMAMRTGEIAVIAPFRYTSLLWALVLGFFVFGDWPRTITLIGAAIVVATGVYTFYRERRIMRRGPVPLRIR